MVSFLFCIVVFYKVSFSFSIFSNESNAAICAACFLIVSQMLQFVRLGLSLVIRYAAICAACFLVISHMLHFGLFGLQIEDIRFLGGHLDGDAFLN